ncbi:LeuA family protein [uncultured Tateyamaria sp.]|uniref:LeuA family protein n=1 Tax=uncultured Tateyamaria sp. TaxID=455651 RepID=UPI00261D4D8C|nr:LeuA family protein [uncultured Tateyamaria sp.]
MEIFETTLRDGEQQAFLHFSAKQKGELAVLLEQLGVDVIDAGFPAASDVDMNGVTEIANETDTVKLSVLTRPIKKDIRRAYQALKGAGHRSRIATSSRPFDLLSISESSEGRARQKTIERSCDLMTEARTYFPEAQYYLICAGNRDISFLMDLSASAACAGATHIVVADTLSTTEPHGFGELVSRIKSALPPEVTLGVHCHNLLGLSLANSIAGVRAGASQVEVTIGNTGDGGGNTALEQMLAYTAYFEQNDPRFANGCDTEKTAEVVQAFKDYTGMQFSPNKPLVGDISFLVETGIHQAIPPKIMQDVFAPETIGRSTELAIGRHSGIVGILDQLDRMNMRPRNVDQRRLYQHVMRAAQKNGSVPNHELGRIAKSLMLQVGPEGP